MDIIEKNIRKAAKEFNLLDEYYKEGFEIGLKECMDEGRDVVVLMIATKALNKGYPIEDITDITGMTKGKILKLQKKLNKYSVKFQL